MKCLGVLRGGKVLDGNSNELTVVVNNKYGREEVMMATAGAAVNGEDKWEPKWVGSGDESTKLAGPSKNGGE